MARGVCALVGAILLVAGVWLVVRPLTALVVLIVALAVALAGGAIVLIVRGDREVWRRAAAVLLFLSGVAVVVFLPAVARALPVLSAVALVVNGVRLVVGVIGASTVAARVVGVLFALASLAVAGLLVFWPDAATVLIAVLFAVALVVSGFALLWRSIRARAKRPGRRPGVLWRGVAASLALVISCAGLVGTWQLSSATARVGEFYTWNGEIPATPGKVLRVAPYDGDVPAGADAVRVLYSTTYSDGTPALASAVVAYPRGTVTQPRTVLAWQHGTTGVTRQCAPSLGPEALTEYAVPGISRALDRGWVIVATDYPGQGTGGRYPYLIGQGEGRATLDAIRAAQQIEDANASDAAWLWGHSQGGHATLWAAEIAGDYAPEIDVIGVAALSAASDPLLLARQVTDAQSSPLAEVVTSLVLVPYADEYADVDLGSSVHPAGQGIVEAFAGRCVTSPSTVMSVLVAAALGADAPLYRIDVTTGPIRDRLRENIADGNVPIPLFLGQGIDDEVIPIDMQRQLASRLCEAGRAVEEREYPGRSHMGVIAADSPLVDEIFVWADSILAGRPQTNC